MINQARLTPRPRGRQGLMDWTIFNALRVAAILWVPTTITITRESAACQDTKHQENHSCKVSIQSFFLPF